jgi:hypothetical protein
VSPAPGSAAASTRPRPTSLPLRRSVGRLRKAALGALAGLCVAALAAGCAPGGGITAAGIERSLGPTFDRLYRLQLAEQGDPVPSIRALHTTTSCVNGSPSQAQTGPGSDWTCHVFFDVDGPGTTVLAIYNLTVQADGCYAADGDGPIALNGYRTVNGPRGTQLHNPLWLIDSCLPLG